MKKVNTQFLCFDPYPRLSPISNEDDSNKLYFTFTAKERDEKTGFSYYGARYYDPGVSALFLSVDPCADKYPGISPYAYCAWNPVKLVDPDGRDIYRLDIETGSLILQKKTKEKYDIIESGVVSGIGRSKSFKTKSTISFSKGILNGRKGQDISKTGFVTCGDLQEEALSVAVYISFSCNKEISGVGYDGIMVNQDLEVFAWNGNSSFDSKNPKSFKPSKGGVSKFHFHTHCGDNKGVGGNARPSNKDIDAASTMRTTYGINTFVLISKNAGSVLYNNTGYISPYVARLPESVKINYLHQ